MSEDGSCLGGGSCGSEWLIADRQDDRSRIVAQDDREQIRESVDCGQVRVSVFAFDLDVVSRDRCSEQRQTNLAESSQVNPRDRRECVTVHGSALCLAECWFIVFNPSHSNVVWQKGVRNVSSCLVV